LIAALAISVLAGGVSPATALAPLGDRQGVVLFARMHAAYRHAAGVELLVTRRGQTTGAFGHFVISLTGGVATAEEFIGAGANPTTVVARAGGPTYLQPPTLKCWRRLASSDPRTLEDVGVAFPYGREGGKAMPPRQTARSWILRTENRERFWYLATQPLYAPTPKRFIVYTIDAKSHFIESMSVQAAENGTRSIAPHSALRPVWLTARLQAMTLATTPKIPDPTPVCR